MPNIDFKIVKSINFAEVLLTDAQLKLLEATPQVLVQAPGGGKFIEFINAILIADFLVAYDSTNTGLRVKYSDSVGVIVSSNISGTNPAFFGTAGKQMLTVYPAAVQQATNVMATREQCENQPLVLHDNVGGGELTLGNAANTMRVITQYRVWSSNW